MVQFLRTLLLSSIFVLNIWAFSDFDPNFELLKRYGYQVERHDIYTVDGYLVVLYRFPNGGATNKTALLVHGIISNAAQWALYSNNLGVVMADKGIDVWMINNRGTRVVLQHKYEPTTSKKFWDFSFHEMAVYGMPAAVDYINSKTGNVPIDIVAHSQGATVVLAFLSTMPEYKVRISSMHLLAPPIFMGDFKNKVIEPFYKMWKRTSPITHMYAYEPGYFDVTMTQILCLTTAVSACHVLFSELYGPYPPQNAEDALLIRFSNYAWDNVSLKQGVHYAQLIHSNRFQWFDYGKRKNKILYGQSTPPIYNISQIETPAHIYYGKNDAIVPVSGIEELISRLPNVKFHKCFNMDHVELVLGKKVGRVINMPMIKSILSSDL